MNGESTLFFTNRPGEEYTITLPNIYARGLLLGTMTYEMGDSCSVTCLSTGFRADLDFKTKGYFTGDYHHVTGYITHRGTTVAKLDGKWTENIFIQPVDKKRQRTGVKTVFFFIRSYSRCLKSRATT